MTPPAGSGEDLVGSTVRDIASGTEGELVAIRCEQLPTHTGALTWTRRAYIRPPGQTVPLATAPGNIRPPVAR
ncbi:hypothetical protein ACIQNV_37235 [Streptomyces hydrogenans]|uniref:hypothetical protein n=1 Tax=Streptomyces hydrogenans TaxID=1873719 RepID=UPI00381B1C2B